MRAVNTDLRWRAWRRRPLAVLLVLGLLPLLACSSEPPTTELDHAVAKEAATQAPDMVDVTVYFRQGRGPQAHLVPVVREIPVTVELARRALDLTLKGPGPQDPKTLRPAIPITTSVRSFAVDGGTASVDLSGAVIRDAATVGARPEHELLALAAVANTLTEFPEITRVAVTVDGRPGGQFWGGWGLPEVLLRDESVIGGETPAAVVPRLGTFSRRSQQAGTPGRPEAVVSSVRIHPRATYLRVTLELKEADGADLVGPLPPSVATRRGDNIRISVAARAPQDIAGEQVIDDPAFRGARVDVRPGAPSVSVTVTPNRPVPFALRTLTDPTRVVLDIRR
jgi:germination protein M